MVTGFVDENARERFTGEPEELKKVVKEEVGELWKQCFCRHGCGRAADVERGS